MKDIWITLWVVACAFTFGVSVRASTDNLIHASPHNLVSVLKQANPGSRLVLEPGIYHGEFVIDKPLTIEGSNAILDGSGNGTVLTLDAPDITIRNLEIVNSGMSLEGPDSCIYSTIAAVSVTIENNDLKGCTFGIWVDQSKNAQLVGNRVRGKEDVLSHEKGNGIHLFDAKGLLVKGNYISYTRDGLYFSATEESIIDSNVFEYTRYGIHYMFSYSNILTNNVSRHNRSGYALMESHHLHVVGNTASFNEEHGLLFRDAEDSVIENNVLVNNGEGLFFFSSADNIIRGNIVRGNSVGAKIWAGSHRNLAEANQFIGNHRQIFYVSTKDLHWGLKRNESADSRMAKLIEEGKEVGNYWGDYLGWDQNGDGIGDRPYRVDSLSANLAYKYPAVKFLMRSPVMELLSHLQERMPVLQVPTLIDQRPLVKVGKEQ